jgi:hypothetical protein
MATDKTGCRRTEARTGASPGTAGLVADGRRYPSRLLVLWLKDRCLREAPSRCPDQGRC